MNRHKLAKEMLKLAEELMSGDKVAARKDVVMISDLSNWTAYFIDNLRQAKDRVDRSAAEEAMSMGDTITMGKVIATPYSLLSQKDMTNLRQYGIGEQFEI